MVSRWRNAINLSDAISTNTYVGRFAPSPSGPLHMGSLICALASFLDAKANRGLWRLRIDDIDPPREVAGASESIQACLRAHHLLWDGEIVYQRQRSSPYLAVLDKLEKLSLTYRCNCTRQRMRTLSGRYDGYCRQRMLDESVPSSIRLDVSAASSYLGIGLNAQIDDLIQGPCHIDIAEQGDFIIHRKDNVFAYQLAASCDDIEQGISRVIRGNDLLSSSVRQSWLIRLMGGEPPEYAHIPVLLNAHGKKLSKQNHAQAVANANNLANIRYACSVLGVSISTHHKRIDDVLAQAVAAWKLHKVPKRSQIEMSISI